MVDLDIPYVGADIAGELVERLQADSSAIDHVRLSVSTSSATSFPRQTWYLRESA